MNWSSSEDRGLATFGTYNAGKGGLIVHEAIWKVLTTVYRRLRL
jgi:hypothetical protein